MFSIGRHFLRKVEHMEKFDKLFLDMFFKSDKKILRVIKKPKTLLKKFFLTILMTFFFH